jgi:pyruvate dehydrogenase E2 component (dihydrolipoamide acetyltransferase)
MATSLIMPALEMAQESGVLVHWLKHDGEKVTKGEPVMEIETDKATVEIEAPDTGVLGGILAHEGDTVPVGQTIGWILAPGEVPPAVSASAPTGRTGGQPIGAPMKIQTPRSQTDSRPETSPLARSVAEKHGIDLTRVKSSGGRIEKADVLAYVHDRQAEKATPASRGGPIPASPKARRLANERGLELASIPGSGPGGAVVTADVLGAANHPGGAGGLETPGTVWRVMAERMTASWTSVPHFFLMRDVDASSLVEWRKRSGPPTEKRTGLKLTFTDILIRLLGLALRDHPRLNAVWADGKIQFNPEINVGLATAVNDGLVVPVIHGADHVSIEEIAALRQDLVRRAHDRKLRPADLAGGTFTLTNLGMYNVDAFIAIVNAPQAAILAIGRIVERVVAVNGRPAVRPMLNLSLSCDHRVVDGARAAQFLDDLAELMEFPWRLLS